MHEKTCIAIILTLLLLAIFPIMGHWLTPKEILATLNDPQNKETAGIREALIDKHTSRLLIIKTSTKWNQLSKADRIQKAEEWYKLWSEHVRKGIVSVLDGESQEPVIKFSVSGKATLLQAVAKPSAAPASGKRSK